jgi:hypothetical protein
VLSTDVPLQLVKEKRRLQGRIAELEARLGETVIGPGGTEGLTWDTAAVRQLLSAAFDDEELTTLCFDHFPPVYEDFAAGMSKGQKIQRLLDYCVRHDQLEALLRQVEARNPAQYARFASRVRRGTDGR